MVKTCGAGHGLNLSMLASRASADRGRSGIWRRLYATKRSGRENAFIPKGCERLLPRAKHE